VSPFQPAGQPGSRPGRAGADRAGASAAAAVSANSSPDGDRHGRLASDRKITREQRLGASGNHRIWYMVNPHRVLVGVRKAASIAGQGLTKIRY
jgi:hypothetical protein